MSDSFTPYAPDEALALGPTRKQQGAQRESEVRDFLGRDVSGLDPSTYSAFDPSSATWGVDRMAREAARRANARGGNYDTVFKNRRALLLKQISDKTDVENYEQRKWEFGQNDAPVYDSAIGKASELMNTAAVSAEQEQALHGKIGGQIAAAKASSLGTVGAALGIRGMADSPAAQALGLRAAEDYDRQMMSQMRDMGLQVTELNRDQLQKSMGWATQLVANKRNAEMAYLNNDRQTVADIGEKTAELVQALYAQDKTFELMEKQIKEANDESMVDRLNGWVGVGKGIAGIAGSLAGMPSTGSPVTSGNRADGTAFAYDDGTQAVPGPMAPRGY